MDHLLHEITSFKNYVFKKSLSIPGAWHIISGKKKKSFDEWMDEWTILKLQNQILLATGCEKWKTNRKGFSCECV